MRRLPTILISLLLALPADAAWDPVSGAFEIRVLTAGAGGGGRSGSAYRMHDDVLGQPVTGSASSASFQATAGFVNDQSFDFTPPMAPVVQDGALVDAERYNEGDTICAGWNSYDPESGIYDHLLGVGTTPLADDVVPLEPVGPATSACLSVGLPLCASYYFVVAARNGSGLLGAAGASNGFFLDGGPDPDLDGLGNVCDTDDDGDGLSDGLDPCPCDRDNDEDGDGWCANDQACDLEADNCARVWNPAQRDTDGDGRGDACANSCRLYVDPDPAQTADCASIEACIERAPEGCRIVIAAGVYDEAPVLSRRLTLEGAGAQATLVRGGPAGPVVTVLAGASGSVVRGLALTGAAAGIEAAGGVTVEHSRLAGVDVGALLVPTLPGRAIRFADTTVQAARLGLDVRGGVVEVERCRIEGSSDAGIRVAGSGRVTVFSSVVANHDGPCLAVDPGATLDLQGSTVTGCLVGVRSTVASATTVAGSIIHGNADADLEGVFCSRMTLSATANDCCAVGRNICGDPRFVDPAADDFRLRADSPCLDSGATLEEYTGVPCVDFTGAPRVVDGNGNGVPRSDRGAFERPNPGGGAAVSDLRFANPFTLEWSTGSAAPLLVYSGDLSALDFANQVECIGESTEGSFDLAGELDPAPGEGTIFLVGTPGAGTCAERTAGTGCSRSPAVRR